MLFLGSGGSWTGGSLGSGAGVFGGVTDGPVLPASPVFTEPPPGVLTSLGTLTLGLGSEFVTSLTALGAF